MAIKIEIIGNSLVLTNTVTSDVIFDAPKSEYYYNKGQLQNGEICFYNIDLSNESRKTPPRFDLSDVVDSEEASLSESDFVTFCRQNLGFKNGGGSGEGTVTIEPITQDDYDNLVTPSSNVLYVIIPE